MTALVLLFALAVCVRCLAGTTGVMNGYVRDLRGRPVAGVLVTVISPSQTDKTYTDKRGFFVFLTLPPDVYTVEAEKAGSYAYAIGARIHSDQTTFLTFLYSAYRGCPTNMRVTLAANQSGEPFSSLDVRRIAQYPPHVAAPIRLPMVQDVRQFKCL